MGLSVITYGGAKAITTTKVNAAMNPATVAVPVATTAPVAVAAGAGPAPAVTVVTGGGPAPMAFRTPAANLDPKSARKSGEENFFRELVENDQHGFDFGDFQMLVVTFMAVGMD